MSDSIIVTPYDERWPYLYIELEEKLKNALGEVAIRIDHIGSTAIPGLDAKPIIDIQISVASFEPLNAFKEPLEKLGFVFKANNPDLTKRYFREMPGTRRTHIHVRQAGSWSEQYSLLFRDYLRCHQEDCQKYADLKYQLAEKFRSNRLAYVDGKTFLIWEIMKKANKWSQEVGWLPGYRMNNI